MLLLGLSCTTPSSVEPIAPLADAHALELRAIQERTLGDARQLLTIARVEGAHERLPELFAVAQEHIDRADAFIARQPHADTAMRVRAEAARFHAGRVFELNRAIQEVHDDGPVAIVLERERRLRRIGKTLGLRDLRARGFDGRWSRIEGEVEAVLGDRDFLAQENRELRAQLASALDEVDRLGHRNAALSAELAFAERFARARDLFEADEAEIHRREGQMIILLPALDFAIGEATISPESQAVLLRLQRAIRIFGRPTVTIEGHTDSTGSRALNQRLSQERAEVVRDYLLANDVLPFHKIVAVGRAFDEPLASNDTPEGRSLNRRIDVILDTRTVRFIASAAAPAR